MSVYVPYLRSHSVRVYSSSISFFFTSSASHPALHSFPTRRSSDLELHRLHSQRHEVRRGARRLQRNARRVGERRDRKSTRLNSSYRCSSYAVFCLTKHTTPPASPHRSAK